MLFEKENLIQSEKEIKLQIYIEQLTNDLYRNEKIEVDSKKILELLSYLTSNENISTEMKTATEYQNRKITDILHKKEVEQLKKYIKYLEQNSAEIKQKNTELAEKSAEIKKYKSLYNKALEDLTKTNRKNIENKKVIDLMVKAMNKIQDPQVCKYCDNNINLNNGYCTDAKKCKEGIKKYFERKVKNEL